MKENKFQVWDIDCERMFYTNNGVTLLELLNDADTCDEEFWLLNTKHVIRNFTGLKDKNGKEIYEGDILRDDCNELHEVKFGKLPLDKSGNCVCTYEAFYCKCYAKLGQSPFYECAQIGDWMEVVGNIYENPELLK